MDSMLFWYAYIYSEFLNITTMKIKVQLHYRDKKELKHNTSEFLHFATLFELELQKASLHDPEENIFVVQLPPDVLRMNVQQHAVAAFCFLKGHLHDLYYNSYPSEKI